MLVQSWVRLILDTTLKVPIQAIALQVVIHGQFSFNDSELQIDGSAVEGIHQAVVVWGGCSRKGSLGGQVTKKEIIHL